MQKFRKRRATAMAPRVLFLFFFIFTAFFHVNPEVQLLRLRAFLDDIDSGRNPEQWTVDDYNVAISLINDIDRRCSWGYISRSIGIELSVIDYSTFHYDSYNVKYKKFISILDHLSEGLGCSPFRHSLWLSMIKIKSYVAFDPATISRYISFARRLSPIQADDLADRLQLYQSIPSRTYISMSDGVRKDLQLYESFKEYRNQKNAH